MNHGVCPPGSPCGEEVIFTENLGRREKQIGCISIRIHPIENEMNTPNPNRRVLSNPSAKQSEGTLITIITFLREGT